MCSDTNRAKRYLKVTTKYISIIILTILVKLLLAEMIPIDAKGRLTAFDEENKFQYREENILNETANYNRPIFEDDSLNDYVEEYLSSNSCQNLYYNIYELDTNKVNIFLNCGTPQNIIYDYVHKKSTKFDTIVKKYDVFIDNVKELLNMKYPSFVTKDVLFDEGVYDIRENELIGYYTTSEFGNVSIKINNNEIADLMTYEMHYDDAYENEKYALDSAKKTIAFTFDDGPSIYDLRIIDSLVASHSTATFYMVGNRMQSFQASISKIIETHMEVGNHTYDHKSLTSLNDEQVKEEITKTNEIFYEMTGKNLTTLRPSYGNVNTRVRLQVGMPVILWSIDTLDWKTRNSEKISESILTNAKDGDIVLMHSLYESTAEAVEKVLPELYKMGFQVVGVEELARLKGYTFNSSSTISNIQ